MEENQQATEQEAEQRPRTPSGSVGQNIVLGLLAVVLLTVSTIMVSYSFGSYSRGFFAQQYKPVDATVDKIEEHFDPAGIRKVAQIKYSINGQECNASVQVPEGRVMKAGELTQAYCDPGNPKSAVLTKDIDYDSIILCGAFGLFILCFGILIAVSVIKKGLAKS